MRKSRTWRPGAHRGFCLLFLFMVLSACGRVFPEPPGAGANASVVGRQISAEGKASLEGYLNTAQLSDLQYPNFKNLRTEAKEFYESTGDTLPWVVNQQPSPQAQAIIQMLQQADREGLSPDDYDGPRWTSRLGTTSSGRAPEPDLIRFDLAVTISTMRYVSNLNRGRVSPRDFHFDLDVGNKNIDLSEFLRQKLVDAGDVEAMMRIVEPPFLAYRQTIDALRTYMKLANQDDNEPLLLPPKAVKPGDSYTSLPRLERLLQLLGDSSADAPMPSGPAYRGSLVTGVKHFQQRHGLEPNGIIDSHTFKELNTPLSERVAKIKLALERWRWLPHKFDRPPIVVNIPEFRLYAMNDDHIPTFTMKVVVGRSEKHQTPVFATELTSVIFRPYWDVPLDIQRKELLPELEKDPDYLLRHSYEVVDSRGAAVSKGFLSEGVKEQLYSGKLAIRQRPGTDNSLGLIKFDMPNGYDVYMHGTPARQLFSRSRRDFSHGCIRVEDPVTLAAWALRDDPEWGTDRIVAAMNGHRTFRVDLAKPIPVLILYNTAIVTESGEVNFFDDIYGDDAVLEQALARGYPYSKNDG